MPKSWEQVIQTNDIGAVAALIKEEGVDAEFIVERPFTTFSGEVLTTQELTTPLIHASMLGIKEIVELLLRSKADVHKAVGAGKWNALQETAKTDHTDILKILIENGADINRPNSFNNWKPLTVAAHYKKKANVSIFIKMKAEADLETLCSLFSDVHCDLAISKKDINFVLERLEIANMLISQNIYSFDNRGIATALNTCMESIIDCANFQLLHPKNPKASYATKLATKNLMLMANSPMMTENIVKHAVFCSNDSQKNPKISHVFGKLIQHHPLWSIYNNPFLLKELNPESQSLNNDNLQRSLNVYNHISDGLAPTASYMPDDLIDLIISYTDFTLEVDFAAAKHFKKQSEAKLASRAIENHGQVCESAAAHSEVDSVQPPISEETEVQILALNNVPSDVLI